MRAQLEKPVIDCPDPRQLAAFYARLLRLRILENAPDWLVLGRRTGMRELAFQRVEPWVPPTWPEPDQPQQMHLDIRVDDVDAAEALALSLGARRARRSPEQGHRVFLDPVGHPFCLVHGRSLVDDPRMGFDTTR
ncbi:VOC family protein [Terrabacter sp. BE26]|uniref:VOC family protein n=1 Tax=Terrabacter sp. BE26 TaxID=2898152 RepID=UPI0035BE5365